MAVGFVNKLGRPAVATVTAGGTGLATATTAYAPVCSGTTATGNFQVASTGLSTAGFVLTSNGSSALPSFKAIPAGGTGTIVQIIYGSTTSTTNLTGTYASIVSASITPTSASNHIFIMGGLSFSSSSGIISIGVKLYKDGAALVTYGGADTELYKEGTTQVILRDSPMYYDAPATTSATTYAFYARFGGGGTSAAANANSSLSNIVLMEIAL